MDNATAIQEIYDRLHDVIFFFSCLRDEAHKAGGFAPELLHEKPDADWTADIDSHDDAPSPYPSIAESLLNCFDDYNKAWRDADAALPMAAEALGENAKPVLDRWTHRVRNLLIDVMPPAEYCHPRCREHLPHLLASRNFRKDWGEAICELNAERQRLNGLVIKGGGDLNSKIQAKNGDDSQKVRDVVSNLPKSLIQDCLKLKDRRWRVWRDTNRKALSAAGNTDDIDRAKNVNIDLSLLPDCDAKVIREAAINRNK